MTGKNILRGKVRSIILMHWIKNIQQMFTLIPVQGSCTSRQNSKWNPTNNHASPQRVATPAPSCWELRWRSRSFYILYIYIYIYIYIYYSISSLPPSTHQPPTPHLLSSTSFSPTSSTPPPFLPPTRPPSILPPSTPPTPLVYLVLFHIISSIFTPPPPLLHLFCSIPCSSTF